MIYSFLYGWNSIATDLSAVLCVRDSTSSDYLSVCSSDRSAILLALLSYLFPLFYQYFNVDQFFFSPTRTALKPALVTVASEWNFRTISFFLETSWKLAGSFAPHS